MNFFSFVFIVAGFIHQITISQSATYYIGNTTTVQWDETLLPNAKEVDIVLYWGTNSTWTVATKIPNNGSVMVGGDLGTSSSQLSIPNGTIGAFYAVENSTSKTESYAGDITVCQSIIFEISGQLVQPGDHIDDIEISLTQELYAQMGGATAVWVANFVTVDEEKMEWSVEEPLDVVPASPTPAPTATTTTTTTTTTTQPPKPGQPTQFFSTAAPEKNNGNSVSSGGLSLAEALRKVSLGSEDPSVQIVSEDCGRAIQTDTWCTVTISVKIPDDASIGGPFDLAIGVLANSTDPLQYYGVNTNSDGASLTTQFLTYDASSVDISWDFTPNRTNNSIYKYERVPMTVTLGDDTMNKNIPIYIVAVWAHEFDYLLECGISRMADDYVVFGWKASIEDSRDYDLLTGPYHFEMYWAVDSDYNNVLSMDEYFQFSDDLMNFHIYDNQNGTQLSPVTLKDDKHKFERSTKTQSVSFETSFNSGTNMTGYITQCNYTANYTGNVTCRYIGNSSFSFTTEEDGSGKAEILFSKDNMFDTSSDDNSTTTTMHISTILCDDFTVLHTNISIDIGKVGGNNNNGLSAGAIVGIVCAGVLVLGLAAWWLCMKKSGSDGYRELNE